MLLGSSRIRIQAADKLPDVDNVKGGALAAASCVPKTSELSKNSDKQGLWPCFFHFCVKF